MLKQEQLESLLTRAMASQADFAEIFEEDGMNESISMLNDVVEKVNRSQKAGVGIRLYKGVQSVYGYSNQQDMDSLNQLVDDLRSGLGKEDKETTVSLHYTKIENKHPVLQDPFQTSLKEKVQLLSRLDRCAKKEDDRIVKTTSGLLSVKQHVQIANSTGRWVEDTRVRTRMVCSAYAQDEKTMQTGFYGPGASAGLEFFATTTPEAIAKEACRVALALLDAKDCPSGKMPVIIDNGFGGVIFHEACGHALEATSVSKNQSVFANKLGQQIASTKVTAIDDGTIVNGWGSENIDDEGNLQQKRVLIKDGILTSYMVDRLNGRRMHMEPTGSSRRQSYKYEPTSRMSNTYIAAGTDSFEEMFAGIKRGLYAKNMGGGSVDPQTGEFNFAVTEGYLIEDGKITVPVKGASLIGTGSEILMNIDRVSDNLKRGQGMCGSISGSIAVDVGQPAIRVSSITVGGTSNE